MHPVNPSSHFWTRSSLMRNVAVKLRSNLQNSGHQVAAPGNRPRHIRSVHSVHTVQVRAKPTEAGAVHDSTLTGGWCGVRAAHPSLPRVAHGSLARRAYGSKASRAVGRPWRGRSHSPLGRPSPLWLNPTLVVGRGAHGHLHGCLVDGGT